jgi:putative SOS response-associated peptidase YedK
MCGRFARIVSDRKLREKYRLKEVPKLDARYNLAPTQPVAAVRSTDEGRSLALFRWGSRLDSG